MISRRRFIITTAGAVLAAAAGGAEGGKSEGSVTAKKPKKFPKIETTKVALIKTADRASGIRRAINLLRINPVIWKDVLLKPNFNTADPFPASTHNDTLKYLIMQLKRMSAKSITVGERSGPPATAGVLKKKDIYELCKSLNVNLINFEELPPKDWVRVRPKLSHWRDGFDVARPVLDSECIVTTCCLKTHGSGGVFTMSLKLSVGITHKKNMSELHSSFWSMRKMIAEINQAYKPALILMDGIEAFVDGGPSEGTKKRADVIVAGTDRIAVDAVGLAVLKELGSNEDIMDRGIFEQEQIARSVELNLGIKAPEEIEIVTDTGQGVMYSKRLMEILLEGSLKQS